MKFLKSYLQVLSNIRLLSKISSFLIAIITFFGTYEILYFSIFHSDRDWINENRSKVFISVTFQVFIAIIFTLRFIFLWFRNNKFIWFSQICWLIGWLAIFAYQLVTAKILFGSFWGSRRDCMDCFYSDTFLWVSSDTIVLIFIAYLFLSPIKQLLTLLFVVFRPKQDSQVV